MILEKQVLLIVFTQIIMQNQKLLYILAIIRSMIIFMFKNQVTKEKEINIMLLAHTALINNQFNK